MSRTMTGFMLGMLIIVPSCFIGRSQSIHTIISFNEVDFNVITSDSLVVFDVDGVLINPASKLFWKKIEKENGEWIGQLYSSAFQDTKKDSFFYFSKMMKKETPVVIEPIIVDIIRKLQNRGVTVIALTTTSTGSCFDVLSLPIWRFEKLRDVGINFSTIAIADKEFIQFPAETSDKYGSFPVFYKGILYTNDVSKGVLLKAFLEYAQLKPSRVIFFDDNISNLESVSQAMSQMRIPFSGYEYHGEAHMAGELDKEVATLQLKHVVDSEEWLQEDEARALLDQQKNNHS